MKKSIMIILLAVACWTSNIGAMAQEMLKLKVKREKSDQEAHQHFTLPKDHALLSIVMNDLYETFANEEGLAESIPLNNATQDEVEALLNGENYDYTLSVHRPYNQANSATIRDLLAEVRKERAKKQAHALNPTAHKLEGNTLKCASDYLNAAIYLDVPELIEKYARIIAIMLNSDASMQLLQSNNRDHKKIIRQMNAKVAVAARIKEYMPDIWGAIHTLSFQPGIIPIKHLLVSVSPDLSRIVVANYDNTAKIWNTQTGALEHTLEGHAKLVHLAKFSPKGTKVVTASHDCSAKIWDAQTGALEHTFLHWWPLIKSASFSADESQIVMASDSATVWNLQTGKRSDFLSGYSETDTRRVEHNWEGFGPDGNKFEASVDSQSILEPQWPDERTSDALEDWVREVQRLEDTISSAEFSPSGRKIVTSYRNATVKIWNATTGSLEHTSAGTTQPFNSAVFSPDESKVMTLSDTRVEILNAQTGESEHRLDFHKELQGFDIKFKSASFSPDGSNIVTAHANDKPSVWNAQTGALEHTLVGHTREIESIKFSSGGSKIVTASKDGTAKIWNAQTGSLENTLVGHSSSVRLAELSPDGTKAVTASKDGTVKIWATLPAYTMEQVLFLKYLQFIKSQGDEPIWGSDWRRAVMDTYTLDESALINKAFPHQEKTFVQKLGLYLGVGSSSSSSSSCNNNNNDK